MKILKIMDDPLVKKICLEMQAASLQNFAD